MDDVEPRRGRPRSDRARAAILAATRDLLREVGYDRLTIADIATRAGVGRQTVYRWWSAKAAIATECVLDGLVELPLITMPATGDPADDLREWLAASHSVIASADAAPLLRALTAAATSDAAAAEQLSLRFSDPLRAAIATSLHAGISAGRIHPDAHVDATADVLLGTLVYAIVTRDDGIGQRTSLVIGILLEGLAPEPRR